MRRAVVVWANANLEDIRVSEIGALDHLQVLAIGQNVLDHRCLGEEAFELKHLGQGPRVNILK